MVDNYVKLSLIERALCAHAASMRSNMVQMQLAERMKMDMMEWISQYAADFRTLLQKKPSIERAIDSGLPVDRLLPLMEQWLLRQSARKRAAPERPELG
jgi:hypothetical protein